MGIGQLKHVFVYLSASRPRIFFSTFFSVSRNSWISWCVCLINVVFSRIDETCFFFAKFVYVGGVNQFRLPGLNETCFFAKFSIVGGVWVSKRQTCLDSQYTSNRSKNMFQMIMGQVKHVFVLFSLQDPKIFFFSFVSVSRNW